MNAVVVRNFGGLGASSIEGVELGVSGAGELIFRTLAVYLNCSDLTFFDRKYQNIPTFPLHHGFRLPDVSKRSDLTNKGA